MQHRWNRFWHKFKNWFRYKEGPGEPLLFLCGSEEGLRQLTTWMCHFYYPDPCDRYGNMCVTYYATSKCEQGYPGVHFNSIHPYNPQTLSNEPFSDTYPLLILRGCKFISGYHAFSGTRWVGYKSDASALISNRPGLPRHIGIGENPACLSITVYPPSAHERAQALLSLSEWLDGKVSEAEKRELLQLPQNERV